MEVVEGCLVLVVVDVVVSTSAIAVGVFDVVCVFVVIVDTVVTCNVVVVTSAIVVGVVMTAV